MLMFQASKIMLFAQIYRSLTRDRMIQLYLISYLLFASIQVLHATCPTAFSLTYHVLRNHVIRFSSAHTMDQCMQQCASHLDCHSINFYASQNKCELNKATHLSNPGDLSSDVLGIYMAYKHRPMNVCSDSLCSTDHICLSENIDDYYCKECATALGMQSRTIPDSAITASSYLSNGHAPYRARLHNDPPMPYSSSNDSAIWIPSTSQVGEYLQIDLGRMVYVTKIATQGRPYYGTQYVTKYQLKYKQTTSSPWMDYLEGKNVKEFAGNSDRDTVVTHALKEKIWAQFIRFAPLAWKDHITLRVEIYGC
ncbi:neuropilin-2-like [Actinia tenebrosa]|uniref:Neuropilin-2-like n=1 Tax=Actinia tenebrosa TaxID=6105 RepID=A0A6P8IN99_ACTTE|nr:neuropilin-2-like [Actinia tenebrosa]